jgi:ribose-phosphate pyrophosphokinase
VSGATTLPVLVFSTSVDEVLAARVREHGHFAAGEVERKRFPDGEVYQRIVSQVRGEDVAIVGGTSTDQAAMELYDLASGLVECGAHSLTLVIPYFGYSTMERAVRPGEVVTAKTRARLFSSIPAPPMGSRVALLDLHSEGLPYYFEGRIRPVYLSGHPVILRAIRELAGGDSQEFVIACTDAGRAKWVQTLANEAGVTASFVFKRREQGGAPTVTAVSAQVQGQHVIIYDDMIRTGSSLLNAAEAYRRSGARKISVVATHGVLPGDALSRLRASGLVSAVVCTDSHPRALELEGEFLAVRSVAPVLADFLTVPP